MNQDSPRQLNLNALRLCVDKLLDDKQTIDYDTENFLMKELSSEVKPLAKWKGMDFSPVNDLQDCIDFLTRVYPGSSYYVKKDDDGVRAFMHSVEYEVILQSPSRALFASACVSHLRSLEALD